MYEKRSDAALTSESVLIALPKKKIDKKFSEYFKRVAKYTLYVLALILLLLTVFLALRICLISPEAGFITNAPKNSNAPINNESVLSVTPYIIPKTGVYYHGIKLGEYEGDNTAVASIVDYYNITLDEHDVLNYSLDTIVSYGMTLTIDSVTYEEEIVLEEIPYDTFEIGVQTIPKGTRQIQTEGVMGSSQKVVRTKHVNGEPVGEAVNFDRYIAPVAEEVLVGTGGVFVAPDGTEYNYSYYIDVTATAYTHTGNRTYTGKVAEVGIIAVDPRNIALGSKVYVIGNYGDYGLCRAEDIGGGIKGKRIDVFLDTEEECVTFGRRKMRAYVME